METRGHGPGNERWKVVMGDILIGIVGLAGIVGVIYLFQKGTSALGSKANQSLFMRGSHREGQELVSKQLVCRVDASREDVRKAILATVKVAPQPSLVFADAYIMESNDSRIVYGYGKKLSLSFRAVVQLLDAKDGRTTVVWNIINWTEGGGIVDGQSVMKRLLSDINSGLRTVDQKASLKISGQ